MLLHVTSQYLSAFAGSQVEQQGKAEKAQLIHRGKP